MTCYKPKVLTWYKPQVYSLDTNHSTLQYTHHHLNPMRIYIRLYTNHKFVEFIMMLYNQHSLSMRESFSTIPSIFYNTKHFLWYLACLKSTHTPFTNKIFVNNSLFLQYSLQYQCTEVLPYNTMTLMKWYFILNCCN